MRQRNKRIPAALLAAALAASLLAGCGVSRRINPQIGQWNGGQGGSNTMPAPDEGNTGPLPTPTPAAGAQPGRNSPAVLYGSAKTIDRPTAVVSVYLDEANGGASWSYDEITESRKKLAAAGDWIQSACAGYGTATQLHFDDGAEGSLLFMHAKYDGRFAGGTDADEGGDFYDTMDTLCEKLDSEALETAYDTDSVAFLLFLPVAGASFTMTHYRDNGNEFYYEYSILYKDDAYAEPGTPECAMVYAHELLHQFGAPDLYEGSSDEFVDDGLVDFVAENWPKAIMYDSILAEGESEYAIDRVLSPVTAYRLGLCADFEGLSRFPALASTNPGIFETEPATLESADEWVVLPGDARAV